MVRLSSARGSVEGQIGRVQTEVPQAQSAPGPKAASEMIYHARKDQSSILDKAQFAAVRFAIRRQSRDFDLLNLGIGAT